MFGQISFQSHLTPEMFLQNKNQYRPDENDGDDAQNLGRFLHRETLALPLPASNAEPLFICADNPTQRQIIGPKDLWSTGLPRSRKTSGDWRCNGRMRYFRDYSRAMRSG